jgi:VanZ family protein
LRRYFKAWWPPTAWALFIFVVTTMRAPYRIFRTDLPLDKLVHFSLYGVLGYLVTRALRISGHASVRAAALGLSGTLAFAALDELHQVWVPTRAPMLGDWVADAVGLALGTGVGVAVLLSTRAGDRSRSEETAA